jgi:hypothetical protein
MQAETFQVSKLLCQKYAKIPSCTFMTLNSSHLLSVARLNCNIDQLIQLKQKMQFRFFLVQVKV